MFYVAAKLFIDKQSDSSHTNSTSLSTKKVPGRLELRGAMEKILGHSLNDEQWLLRWLRAKFGGVGLQSAPQSYNLSSSTRVSGIQLIPHSAAISFLQAPYV